MIIDRAKARELNATLNESLKAWAELNGLVLEPYRLRFTENDLRCRLKFDVATSRSSSSSSGIPGHRTPPPRTGADMKLAAKQQREALNYKMRAPLLKLPPLGTKIKIKGMILELTGMRVKKVVLRDVATGKTYKMDASAVNLYPKV